MDPRTCIEIEDLKLEWIKEAMTTIGWDRKFAITIRITNQSSRSKFVVLKPEYISISKGRIEEGCNMSHYMYSGQELLSNSFVDVKISCGGLKRSIVSDGDRIELKIPKIASLLLKRHNSQWYFVECNKIISNDEIKAKIEQFETIEEKIGITFQNFSVHIKDEQSFDLFVETMITDEERCKGFPKIPLKLVLYDNDNNVIHMQGLNLYNNGYSIFQVLVFSVNISESTLSNISRIRIFPSI